MISMSLCVIFLLVAVRCDWVRLNRLERRVAELERRSPSNE